MKIRMAGHLWEEFLLIRNWFSESSVSPVSSVVESSWASLCPLCSLW
jgi:hypothetical protein